MFRAKKKQRLKELFDSTRSEIITTSSGTVEHGGP